MRFSVVIPVYNKASTIGAAVESVLTQTFSDYEIIVVDDGSTDDVVGALEMFSDRIKLIRRENGGVSAARNTGIRTACGDYVCFLDADDIWLENHLSVLDSMISAFPNESFFFTSFRVVDCDGNVRESRDRLSRIGENTILTNDLIGLVNECGDGIINTNGACLERRILLENDIFFAEGEKIGEDTDMWYRASLLKNVVISKTVTSVYRREYSDATKFGTNTQDWIFARRIPDILKRADISDRTKEECKERFDRYTLACCRELAYNGERRKAFERFKKVYNKASSRAFVTALLCLVPVGICRRILDGRIFG